jgi:hypothetical protein
MTLASLCTTPIAYINPITHNRKEGEKKRRGEKKTSTIEAKYTQHIHREETYTEKLNSF